MNLDESCVEALISELIDENSLACRALLSIARTEFTTDVPTAAVSLGEHPVLRINLDFVRQHCATEQHVKALLVHEFLHVLLRHTLEIRRMNPALMGVPLLRRSPATGEGAGGLPCHAFP